MSLKHLFSFGRSMHCDAVMAVLQSYLDGETDVDTARKVARHLDRCADCSIESEVYTSIQHHLANRPFEIDPEIRARLEAFGRSLAHERPGSA
ncbi:MAG: zf-HC2 domain-containing protein [Actinomycetota bacterium]|nr:zf-HC2 domain-containing protein [Actinomycetota bacterium]